jgi:hypothetical protein
VNCCNQLHKGPIYSIIKSKIRLISHASLGHVTIFGNPLNSFRLEVFRIGHSWTGLLTVSHIVQISLEVIKRCILLILSYMASFSWFYLRSLKFLNMYINILTCRYKLPTYKCKPAILCGKAWIIIDKDIIRVHIYCIYIITIIVTRRSSTEYIAHCTNFYIVCLREIHNTIRLIT